MSEVSIPRSRLSLFAVVMLFLVGVFTVIFQSILVGIMIIGLSVLLYLILGWLTSRFAKGLKQVDENIP
jgi:hypothetical protein